MARLLVSAALLAALSLSACAGGGHVTPVSAAVTAGAEAFLIDLPNMRLRVPRMFDRIFGTTLPDSVLTPSARPADHVAFFSEHSTAA